MSDAESICAKRNGDLRDRVRSGGQSMIRKIGFPKDRA
jgi:hypothetical protein